MTQPYIAGTPSADQRSADTWNYFFRDKLAFGGNPEVEAFLPKLLKETHDAAIAARDKVVTATLSQPDIDNIVTEVVARIGNSVAESVLTLMKEQWSK